MNKVIAIDFDDTIHDAKHPIKGRKMGGLVEGALPALETLQRKGYEIIIFCYWADSEVHIKAIRDWLIYFNCPFNDITNIKLDADFFLDDRAIRFIDWQQSINDIENFERSL